MKIALKPPLLTRLSATLLDEKEVALSVLRLDSIHPAVNGNKWYKLKYNLEEFARLNKKYLVTAGGAYSNHIMAVAAAGRELNIKTAGIIRGRELHANSNPVLRYAAQNGMELHFVSREEYREMRKHADVVPRLKSEMKISDDEMYFLPEGGSNALAVKGCAEILNTLNGDFDTICCACGTGATLAGISAALDENRNVLGISVLKGEKFLEEAILKLNGNRKNFQLRHEYSFGGYARSTPELDLFCRTFSQIHQIKTEPVYTGKMFYGLLDLVSQNYFEPGTRMIAVHSGGVHDFHVT